MIGFLGDQLDPRDVRVIPHHQVEQPLEQLPADALPLRAAGCTATVSSPST